MSLPFPHIEEHREYPVTFLRRVEVRLHYTVADPDFHKKLREAIAYFFDLDYPEARFKAMGMIPVRMSREKDGKENMKIKISDDFLELSIKGSAYQTFLDSVAVYLAAFGLVFEEVGALFRKIEIKKINAFNIKRPSKDEMERRYSSMFSTEYLESGAADLSDCFVEAIHRYLIVEDNENASRQVELFSSLEAIPDNEESMVLSLVTRAMDKSEFRADSLSEISEQLNSMLYDAFHWAINPSLLKFMSDPDQYRKKKPKEGSEQ